MKPTISKVCIPLIVTLVTFFFGCGGQTAVVESMFMNDEERNELRAAQAKLDDTLRKHSPFVYDELAPSATDAEIEKLRAELDVTERPYLELWFKWHNGCTDHPMRLLPLGDLISVDESIEDRSSIQDMPFVHQRRKRDIKLLDDGCGDGFFLDLTASPPRIYYEMLEDRFPTDYGTMLQFLQFIDRVHTAGITSVNEREIVIFDATAYQKLEAEHLSSVKKGAR